MISTLIFSKNRAAQLDLLLRTLEQRAPTLTQNTHVIYTATTETHERSYRICANDHRATQFETQNDFHQQVMFNINRGTTSQTMFLCDDDIVTRPFIDNPHPEWVLHNNQDVLTVSLRLGTNTTSCYPLRRNQKIPPWIAGINDARFWRWQEADADFGYPGSLDGNVYRRNQLRTILSGAEFRNPNELEDQLSQSTRKLHFNYPLMCCYESSLITGIPINLVNDTHLNRHGEKHFVSSESLNDSYLKGKRLKVPKPNRRDINAAHTELQLVFP